MRSDLTRESETNKLPLRIISRRSSTLCRVGRLLLLPLEMLCFSFLFLADFERASHSALVSQRRGARVYQTGAPHVLVYVYRLLAPMCLIRGLRKPKQCLSLERKLLEAVPESASLLVLYSCVAPAKKPAGTPRLRARRRRGHSGSPRLVSLGPTVHIRALCSEFTRIRR